MSAVDDICETRPVQRRVASLLLKPCTKHTHDRDRRQQRTEHNGAATAALHGRQSERARANRGSVCVFRGQTRLATFAVQQPSLLTRDKTHGRISLAKETAITYVGIITRANFATHTPPPHVYEDDYRTRSHHVYGAVVITYTRIREPDRRWGGWGRGRKTGRKIF